MVVGVLMVEVVVVGVLMVEVVVVVVGVMVMKVVVVIKVEPMKVLEMKVVEMLDYLVLLYFSGNSLTTAGVLQTFTTRLEQACSVDCL